MLLLQKDLQELHVCNVNSNTLIEKLQKENTILQISIAEKLIVSEHNLQAKVDATEEKLHMSNLHKDEALGIIAILRKNLKNLEKALTNSKQHNVELRECIILYEQRFEGIISELAENKTLQFSGDPCLDTLIHTKLQESLKRCDPAPHP